VDNELSYIKWLKSYKEGHKKFNYYLLGVSLAALSLSVQAFESQPQNSSDFLMIIVWILLLLSVLCGFYRLEKIVLAELIEVDILEEIEVNKRNASSKPVDSKYKVLDKIDKKMITTYQIQKWSLLLALVVFVVYKSIPIILTIVK